MTGRVGVVAEAEADPQFAPVLESVLRSAESKRREIRHRPQMTGGFSDLRAAASTHPSRIGLARD